MALLPTGSDKLLEIRTSDIDLVIKSKNIQTAVAACAESSLLLLPSQLSD